MRPGLARLRSGAYHARPRMEDANTPSLLAAVRILAREGTLDARLTALAREARTVSGGAGAITLLRDEGGAFATPAGDRLELDPAALAVLQDAAEERRATWSASLPTGLAALAGASTGSIVPMLTADETGPLAQGVLLLGGGDTASEPVRDTLGALGGLAAMAVEQERLRAALRERGAWQERLARTDPLTGLADQATFLQMLELEVVRATRQGTALAVVLFAVDDIQASRRPRAAAWRTTSCGWSRPLWPTGCDCRHHRPPGLGRGGVVAPGDASGTVARRVLDGWPRCPTWVADAPGARRRGAPTRWTAPSRR